MGILSLLWVSEYFLCRDKVQEACKAYMVLFWIMDQLFIQRKNKTFNWGYYTAKLKLIYLENENEIDMKATVAFTKWLAILDSPGYEEHFG